MLNLSVSMLAGAALAIASNALMLTGRRKRSAGDPMGRGGAEDPMGRGGAEAFQRHVVKVNIYYFVKNLFFVR